ncbi:hypothetical protein Q4555_15175 [Octadecabacter sp. 1_MG-2023]|nr:MULTISPECIES: hypothetical protein [unclassified Octadecabacter]MDO6736020.1 hypothetical protein [Octadecabacter sp. 1_MG-2023]
MALPFAVVTDATVQWNAANRQMPWRRNYLSRWKGLRVADTTS